MHAAAVAEAQMYHGIRSTRVAGAVTVGIEGCATRVLLVTFQTSDT